jgi:Domain of unknown function (DUF4124)
MRVVLIIVMTLMGSAVMAFAQAERQQQVEDKATETGSLYQWVDDKGDVHITDNLGSIPKKYRYKARRLEGSAANEESPEQIQPEKTSPTRIHNPEGTEDERKIEWQQRMKEARQQLAGAEKRYRELDQKRNELLGAWGGVASGHLEDRMKAQKIEEEMQQVQREIDSARNEVENVIPEQARKAGVPPGWLRE